ncbi:hypothetical protein DLNHIDIE_03307 [Acidithiobacillus thiooxidans ATCC 19377]|uniref:Uncharacterized protein n=1 Tax=Acidithiobacillus thiooxidans ATCC 19377 TaxID=637390 RepID=A0A543PZF5_ACITH|nr:hypothetical protein DLNHIDIE_03307 [Acidithiobacillus thiooxidans ATCC 19377]
MYGFYLRPNSPKTSQWDKWDLPAFRPIRPTPLRGGTVGQRAAHKLNSLFGG